MARLVNLIQAYLIPLIGTACSVWTSSTLAQALPDFTRLVEANAPAIVNVSTTYSPRANSAEDRQELEELLKYFYGDRAPRLDMPAPMARSVARMAPVQPALASSSTSRGISLPIIT